MRQELFDYQVDALMRVRRMVAGGCKRLIICAPTGAGKTTIAAELIHGAQARGSRTVFLAHRKELIQQCSRRLDDWSVDHGIIQASHPRYRPRATVQVASVNTLANRIKSVKSSIEADFNLIIIDEAHRSTAPTYTEIVNAHPASTVVIGLTATPCRLSGKPLGMFYDDLIIVTQPQELCTRINPKTGSTYLIEPDIYAPVRPEGLQTVRVKSTGDYDTGELTLVMDKPKLVGGIVEHWAQIVGRGKRTVVFATSVAHAEHIQQAFIDAGVRTGHVNGKTPSAERDETLNRFRAGELEVLTNVEILTEGWDLPELDAIVLARPTKSLCLYLQMVGRVLRSAPGKAHAYVIDHADNVRAHGFPTESREWQLHGNAPKKTDAPPIKNCPKCAYVVAGGTKLCPACGYVWETSTREEIEHEEGQLVKVAREQNEARQAWLNRELAESRQARFKDGYAWHRYRDTFGEFPSSGMKSRARNSYDRQERKHLERIVEMVGGRQR